MNQRAKYLGQMSFSSEVIVQTHKHTHNRPIALPGPLKWLGAVTVLYCVLQCADCNTTPHSNPD